MPNAEVDRLCKELETTTGLRAAEFFIRRIEEGETDPFFLYSIAIERTDRVGFRSAWVLEKLCEKTPDYAQELVERLVADFRRIENPSTLRVLTKLLGRYLKQRNNFSKRRFPQPKGCFGETKQPFDNCKESTDLSKWNIEKISPVIERCFEALIDPEMQFSVKQMCCELLLLFKDREEWIKEELQAWCDGLVTLQLPAATAYRRRLSKSLQSEKVKR